RKSVRRVEHFELGALLISRHHAGRAAAQGQQILSSEHALSGQLRTINECRLLLGQCLEEWHIEDLAQPDISRQLGFGLLGVTDAEAAGLGGTGNVLVGLALEVENLAVPDRYLRIAAVEGEEAVDAKAGGEGGAIGRVLRRVIFEETALAIGFERP